MTRLFSLALALLLAVPVWAAELGDDGLHKAHWMRDTFKDLPEDLAEATAEGKRLLVIVEQRGCIYCTKMHEEIYPIPEIDALLTDDFFVVQINMFGDTEVVDFDGEVLSEKDLVRKWGLLFTPTLMFFPEEAGPVPGNDLAVATIPGAFGRWTTQNMLTWVLEKGYDSDEPFQKYHARKFAEHSDNQ
ncbi:MAG: thioredoxin [Rhodobacteraceae bacterium]|nr:thioredoxin [Paracoccaceae bacterium]